MLPKVVGFLFALVSLAGCRADTGESKAAPQGLPRYVQQLRQDVARHCGRCNPRLACYVDLSLPDTGYRFFLVDVQNSQVLLRGLCLNCRTDARGQVLYSNRVNSNCSSRGLARVASRYTGSFGRSYRLVGLEASTSNLPQRAVVLHSWPGVPAAPTTRHPIQSQGCPTLNPEVLDALAGYLDRSAKPVLVRLN
jgi:hypothetical protein